MKARRKKPSARGSAASRPAARRPRATEVRTSSVAPARAKAASKARASKPVVLGADCTIEHAPGLHKNLVKLLTDRACVTVDVTAVKRCDTAGLQVLVAFVRERREAGREVQLTGASENFLATTKLLGLSALTESAA
jgi:ABC-type transporter Mla MlaB component